MKSKLLKILITSFIGLLVLPCSAQVSKGSTKVRVKVDLVSLGENIPNLYLGKNKKKTVDALAFRYDKTIRYNGGQWIEICQSSNPSSKLDSDGQDKQNTIVPLIAKKIPKNIELTDDKLSAWIYKRRKKNPNLVALAKVPNGARQITILLSPSSNDTYKAHVLNDDPKKFSYGKVRIHNFCNHSVQFKFPNKKALVLKQGKSHQVKPRGNNNTLRYLLSYPKNKKWKPQESNIMRVTKDEQVHMVVLSSNASFFQSSSGNRGGHLQVAFLKRNRTVKDPEPVNPDSEKHIPALPDGRAKK